MPCPAPARSPLRLIAAVVASCALPGAASAELTRSLTIPAVKAPAALITGILRHGWQTAGGKRMAGLELRLAPGWKTYWRAPGDAGIPPHFDWSGSENVKSARIIWPSPEVFKVGGERSIGYVSDVVLPVEVTPHDPSRPMRLQGRVDLGVCRDICVPAELSLDAVLSGAGGTDPAIHAALASRPATAREAGLGAVSCRVEPIRDGLRITAEMTLPARGRETETVVIEPPQQGVWVSAAQVQRQGNHLHAVAEMVDPSGAPFALDRSGIMITVLGPHGAVEHRGCPAP